MFDEGKVLKQPSPVNSCCKALCCLPEVVMRELPALINARCCLLRMFSGNLRGSLVQLTFTGTHLTWAGDAEVKPFQVSPVVWLLLWPEAILYFSGGEKNANMWNWDLSAVDSFSSLTNFSESCFKILG